MDSLNLASGDGTSTTNISPRSDNNSEYFKHNPETTDEVDSSIDVTAKSVEDNETNLQNRISQCRNIIETLKHELNEEKAKMERESKAKQLPPEEHVNAAETRNVSLFKSNSYGTEDLPYNSCAYSSSVDRKLTCDENLMEYEKQLQKYQNTLNMAQIEKKNAIRKQMLAKAFKLKLLEVENQCNIELLRVKQSLKCLEPLHMIAQSWKVPNADENIYDFTNFELIPRYPELHAHSASDVGSLKDEEKINAKNNLEQVKDDDKPFELV